MKHFLKKKIFQGAGGKGPKMPKPKPAILRPPNLGKYQILNSFSIIEIIDLISDGPIGGLVNALGQRVKDGNILQALYLNNTPTMTTEKITSIEIGGELGDLDLSPKTNPFGRYFYQPETNLNKASFKTIKIEKKDILPVSTKVNVVTKNNQTKNVIYDIKDVPTLNRQGLISWGGHLQDKNAVTPIVLGTPAPSNNTLVDIVNNTVKNVSASKVPTFSQPSSLNQFKLLKNNNKIWGQVRPGWKKINDCIFEYEDWRVDAGSKIKISESHFQNLKEELQIDLKSNLAEQRYFANLAIKNLQNVDKLYEKNPYFLDIKFNKKVNGYCSSIIGTKNNTFKIPKASGKSIYQKNNNGEFVLDSNGNKIIDDFYYYLEDFTKGSLDTYEIVVPIIQKFEQDIIFTGEFYGGIIINIDLFLNMQVATSEYFLDPKEYIFAVVTNTILSSEEGPRALIFYPYLYISEEVGLFIGNKLKFGRGIKPAKQSIFSKYNFANISLEYRPGEEKQDPLDGFKQTYIDYDYNAELYGPFSKDLGTVERIGQVYNDNSAQNPNILGSIESSVDLREGRNYSNWNDINQFKELPGVFTHTVENPNVTSVSFSLAINNLYDTIDKDEGTKEGDRKIGERRPSIVRIRVETGEIGKKEPFFTKRYAITALVEGLMIIDFGCPDLTKINQSDKFFSIRDTSNANNKYNEASLSIPYRLPVLDPNADTTRAKRYIKIIKESAETNSVLIEKDISLYKVTEIITNQLSYPFSAIAGIKLDARTFESIPERSYDCRLKLIKIPENYFPLKNTNTEEDKRYYSTIDEYNNTSKINKLVYNGDWSGKFKIGWTDNPAWILYDLLTNKRYGLGAYLDESQINKWELYKIARFCDAVDEDGFFIGVPDGIGGLEPRYSCNILIKDATKVYDSIISITNLFRGMCYFSNSEVHFLDDRPRNPIMTFSNINVKDGIFNYSNIRKDQQYNTIEVSYLDRFENFQVKIEVVEDDQDIRKRGIFKTRIETFGVTSRAMARRIGQHMIYQTIKENQGLEFVAGLEALLCRPGDLIIVEDDLKTRASNFGRILYKNEDKKSLILENQYLQNDYDNKITVYTPTGYTTITELENIADLNRYRIPYFTVKENLLVSDDSILNGTYYFNKYDNFTDFTSGKKTYPLYVGKHALGHDLYCYYNTGASGFVFATGLPYQDNNVYSKVITNTGVDQISDIINIFESTYEFLKTGFRYNSISSNKRGTLSGSFINKLSSDFKEEYKGILPSEINTVNYPQITNYRITGYDNSINNNYGCEVLLDKNDININLTPFIKEGSPYKIARKNAEDQIYKILAIKEENQNEYIVVATKYNTGKFIEIENFIMEDFLPNTFYSGPTNVNNINFKQLDSPKIKTFTSGVVGSEPNVLGFVLSGSWEPIANASVYRYTISNEIFQIALTGETNSTQIITNRLQNLGDWKLNVYAANDQDAYSINSLTSTTGFFAAFNNPGVVQYEKAAILNFTIT